MSKLKRQTGFSPEDREIITHRSGGYCERCNRRPAAHIHHRKPRRMGGRYGAGFDDVNRPSNGIALCLDCHQWAETQDRAEAIRIGIILPESADPADTPVTLPRYRGPVILDDLGGVTQCIPGVDGKLTFPEGGALR